MPATLGADLLLFTVQVGQRCKGLSFVILGFVLGIEGGRVMLFCSTGGVHLACISLLLWYKHA